MVEAVTVGARVRLELAALRCTGAYALAEWCAVEAHRRLDAGDGLADCLAVAVPAGKHAFRSQFGGHVLDVGGLLLAGMHAKLWTVPTYSDGTRTHAKTRTFEGAKVYDLRLSAEFVGRRMKHAGALLPIAFDALTELERLRVPVVAATSVPWFGGAVHGRAAEFAALDAVLIAFGLRWKELETLGGLPRGTVEAAIARHSRNPSAVFDCWLAGDLLRRHSDGTDAYTIGDDATWEHVASGALRRVAYRAKMTRPKRRRGAVSAVA